MRDADIRERLRRHLHGLSNADGLLVIDELGLCAGAVRCDVTMINGAMHGFEIKSDADRLHRLTGQIEAYDRVFDYSTVVTGPRHTRAAGTLVPAHWGIWECTEHGFDVVRSATLNQGHDPRSLAQLLWRSELLRELRDRNAARGLSSQPLGPVWDRVCETIDLDELRYIVRHYLKDRGDWRANPPLFTRAV